MQKNTWKRSCFFIFSLEKNVVQDITQSEDTLEPEMLIHDNQTVDSGLADGIKDSVQSIVERTGVDTREALVNHEHKSRYVIADRPHTAGRFFSASPTVRLKSS